MLVLFWRNKLQVLIYGKWKEMASSSENILHILINELEATSLKLMAISLWVHKMQNVATSFVFRVILHPEMRSV